jgi:hypothetical protein
MTEDVPHITDVVARDFSASIAMNFAATGMAVISPIPPLFSMEADIPVKRDAVACADPLLLLRRPENP